MPFTSPERTKRTTIEQLAKRGIPPGWVVEATGAGQRTKSGSLPTWLELQLAERYVTCTGPMPALDLALLAQSQWRSKHADGKAFPRQVAVGFKSCIDRGTIRAFPPPERPAPAAVQMTNGQVGLHTNTLCLAILPGVAADNVREAVEATLARHGFKATWVQT